MEEMELLQEKVKLEPIKSEMELIQERIRSESMESKMELLKEKMKLESMKKYQKPNRRLIILYSYLIPKNT